MPRADATAPPDAIRIEDEVWQEAFARREPGQSRSRRHLQAVDGDRTSSTLESHPSAPDQTAEPIAPPDWLGSTTDSKSASGVDSRGSSRPDAAADPPTAPAPRPVASSPAAPTRRTVVIRGRGAEDYLPWADASRRRPPRRPYERAGFRPDRLAMWAVLLGFLLVVVAIVSAH